MSLTINPRSKSKLAAVEKDLPHAILLTGRPGVGLYTIARSLAGKNQAGFLEPLDNKGQSNHETGTIAIDSIRRLYEQTRSKQSAPSVYIIDDAERMSLGAQSAFLKLLEEPNDNTHYILTSHFPQTILPTIRSRVQAIAIDPITSEQTEALLALSATMDEKKKTQLKYLAAGLPAELTRLMSDEAYFKQQADTMVATRTFLTGSTYEKLLLVNDYQKDRAKTLQLLDSAITVTRYSLTNKPNAALVVKLEQLLRAREKIEANCSARLQLTALVLQY